MVNEGAKILEEGMAQRALDIDVIWVNGYGWPVYRGGPMWWADNVVGLKTIHDALLQVSRRLGRPVLGAGAAAQEAGAGRQEVLASTTGRHPRAHV